MRLLFLLVACFVAAAFPTLAHADSVVYMKGGNVWIANSDFTGARQFTLSPYAWHSPSEADNGTVVVAGGPAHSPYGDAGSDLYRFSGDGNQVGGAIPTSGTYANASCNTHAPYSVRVSFDAAKIAYGSFLCGSQENTTYWTPSTSTGLNFPNQSLGQRNYYEPAWQDNAHFVVSHSGPTSGTQARWGLHDVAAADNTAVGAWDEPMMTGNGQQGLISRAGTTFAVFEDDASDQPSGKPTKVHVWVYSATSLAAAEASGWTKQCEIPLDASKTTDPFHLSPSFSPDGKKLLWADDIGLKVMPLGDVTSGCSGGGGVPVAVVPGGSEPFYSAGNLQAGAANPTQPRGSTTYTPPPTNPPPNTPANPPPPNTPTTTTPTPLIPLAAFKVKTRKARAGRPVKFDAGESKETGGQIVSYLWTFGDGKKAKGRLVTHKYKKPGKYTVTLTIADAKGKTATAQAKVKVAR